MPDHLQAQWWQGLWPIWAPVIQGLGLSPESTFTWTIKTTTWLFCGALTFLLNANSLLPLDIALLIYLKVVLSLDPSKISKSGWWGLQLDTWQLCNSLWYGLINSKLHINKKLFFISHNIRRCHRPMFQITQLTSQGWTWPLTPADLHTLLGKPARRDIITKFLKDQCCFLYPLPTKWNKYCVSSVLIPNDCQCSSKEL